MSNETDLDWLARNVHKWIGRGGEKVFRTDKAHGGAHWIAYPECLGVPFFTKAQWLARRAELQNKPGWKDVPSHANWLAQDAAGSWLWHSSEPEPRNGMWIGSDTKSYAAKGCVLGDWCDTLERRPESTRAEMEVELVKAAFKPFTSIEDNQEQDMAQQQEMKQDNGWLERGELPPVGARCEALITSERQWVEIEVVCHRDGFALGWCPKERCGYHGDEPTDFRPIRTERDVLLSVIVEEMNHCDTDGKLADAILAAGFSLGAK